MMLIYQTLNDDPHQWNLNDNIQGTLDRKVSREDMKTLACAEDMLAWESIKNESMQKLANPLVPELFYELLSK